MVLAVTASLRQAPGWPDRYIAHKYWTGWVEFKRWDGRLSVLQLRRLQELNARGVNALACWFLQDGMLHIQNCTTDAVIVVANPQSAQSAAKLLRELSIFCQTTVTRCEVSNKTD